MTPAKPLKPAKILAKGERNLEWIVKKNGDELQKTLNSNYSLFH